MAFLTFSLTLTYEVITPSSPTTAQPPRSKSIDLSKRTPVRQQRTNNTPPHRPHTASPPPSDHLASLLSLTTQHLQNRIRRARMLAQQGEADVNNDDDAGSLEVLEAVEARRARVGRARERALDRESLWVLEREWGKLEGRGRGKGKETPPKLEESKGSEWSGSSFEKIDMGEAGTTPGLSPTPGVPASAVPREQQRGEDPFASPSHGRESDFVRSLVESRIRREEGGVWREGEKEVGGGKAGVAELMRRFEDLEARERVRMEGQV